MGFASGRRGAVTMRILIGICIVFALTGAGYGLFMLTRLTGELSTMSAKLSKLDTMTAEVERLNERLSLLSETNNKLKEMETYMRYMPVLANVGKAALAESIRTDKKLDITNARLGGTNSFLQDTTRKLQTTNLVLMGMRSDIGGMNKQNGSRTSRVGADEESLGRHQCRHQQDCGGYRASHQRGGQDEQQCRQDERRLR